MKTPASPHQTLTPLQRFALAVAVAGGLFAGTALAAPANDDFANAIALTGVGAGQTGDNITGTQTGTDNIDATQETGETVGSGGTNTVWFNWICPADGALTVTTLGSTNSSPSEWDAVLGIYTGASVNALTPLGGSPQDGNYQEQMTVPVTAGTTYHIQLAGYGGEVATNILLSWTLVPTNGAQILTFGPGAVIGTIVFNAAAITWNVLEGSNLATLAPTFTLSAGATCTVNSSPLVSGGTVDFSGGPVNFTVTAAGVSPIVNVYTVTVAEVGETFNVNFTGGTAETESSLSGPAGGLGTTWNQFAGPNSSGTLVNFTGAPSSVTITTNFDLPNTFDSAAIALPMLRGSMTNFGKGVDDTSVTLSGLVAGGFYNIWLVTLRNQPYGGDGTEQYVGWWSTTNGTTSPSNQLVNAVGATVNTSTFVAGYNYVLFENVEANGSGQIVFTGIAGELLNGTDNNHRHGLNGLQIQKTTPPVIGAVDDAMSTVNASPATVFADGVLTSTVTVTLRDANGLGVPNKNVTLANTSGPQAATIDPLTAVTTNGAGQALFTVKSTTPGIEVFTATDVTDTLTLTDTASVGFVEVGVLTNAAQSTVVASPIARLADGSSTSTITVTLRDANGYPVAGKDVDLTNSGGNIAATISPPGVVTSDINGQAEFSVSSSTIGAEQFTATDTTDSIVVTQIATVNFIDPSAPKIISVNFAGANADDEPVSTLSGPAGGLGTTWNQVVGTGGSGALLDSTGVLTTVSISHDYGLTADDDATTLPILQGSVANFGKGDDATVTISGLAAGGSYDIWLVSLRNQGFGGDGTEQYYGNWSTPNATSSASSQVLDAVDPTVNTSTFVAGYNYVLFENVVATAGGQIVFTADAAEPGEVSADGNRFGLNGIQIQEASGLTTYASWSGGAPANGDVNNDGVQNAVAWVLGAADPNENAVALIPTLDNTTDPDFFFFNHRRSDTANADGTTAIKVEYSSDLVNWPDAVAGPDIVITPFNDAYAAGIDRVEVKIRRTLAVGGKLFARLNVVVTP